jgi:chromosome segregation ATPase
MTNEEMFRRVLNAQETIIERMADLAGRVGEIEANLQGLIQVLEAARQTATAHNYALDEAASAFADINGKLRQLSQNDMELREELMRQRAIIGGPVGGVQ